MSPLRRTWSLIIRSTVNSLNEARPRLNFVKATGIYRRLFLRSRKRLVRYSLLGANLVLLGAVVVFVVRNPNTSQSVQNATVGSSTVAANPLDQLSSADIAVNVARLTSMAEATSVKNYAESFNAQLTITSADNTVVAKPQIVATSLKSRKDIERYVTVEGDTISSLAAKFGVTSNTIRWSNGLGNGEAIGAGKEIYVLPGVNGIVLTAKEGDTPDSLAQRYQANKVQIIEYNDAETGGLPVGKKIIIPEGMQMVQRATATTQPRFAFGFSATYGYNGYDYGWCTWYAANRRAELGRPVPSNLGNAYSWYYLAQQAGLPTGLSPAVGAVAVNTAGNHVSVVEAVNSDGSFWVSEMNSRGQVSMTDSTPTGGWARRDYKMYASAGNLKFIY